VLASRKWRYGDKFFSSISDLVSPEYSHCTALLPYRRCAITTLSQREVQDVLFRLYAEAQANDSKVQAEEQTLLAAAGGIIDDQTLQSINDRTFMAVAPEVGRLIYLLVRSHRPALVVEHQQTEAWDDFRRNRPQRR
jgi:hypothetical protein